MNQVSAKLRRYKTGYSHWCPGCEEAHALPDTWTFNGNLDRPTFTPSFLHTNHHFPSYTVEGIGIGEKFKQVCHYVLTDGVLNFCGDSHHHLKNQSVPLPDLPKHMIDEI